MTKSTTTTITTGTKGSWDKNNTNNNDNINNDDNDNSSSCNNKNNYNNNNDNKKPTTRTATMQRQKGCSLTKRSPVEIGDSFTGLATEDHGAYKLSYLVRISVTTSDSVNAFPLRQYAILCTHNRHININVPRHVTLPEGSDWSI